MTPAADIVMDASEKHKVAYADVVALLQKHAAHLSALEMLAVAANLVGKLVAMQDARTTTLEAAMETVQQNIKIGNHEIRALLGNGELRH